MWQWLRRRFLTGFFVTVPLFISVAALVWIFNVVDGFTTPLYDRVLGQRQPLADHPRHELPGRPRLRGLPEPRPRVLPGGRHRGLYRPRPQPRRPGARHQAVAQAGPAL